MSFNNFDYTDKPKRDFQHTDEIAAVITKHAEVAFVICSLQHAVLYSNDKFEQLFGWHPNELLGYPLPTVLGNERTDFNDLVTEHFYEYTTKTSERWHRDGFTRVVRESISPLRNHKGEITSYIYIVKEHNEGLNQELVSNKQPFQSLFDNNPDAVLIINPEGQLTGMNPTTYLLSGYDREELLLVSLLSICPPEQHQHLSKKFERALRGRPQNFETFITHKNGTRIDLHLSLIPIANEGDNQGIYAIAKTSHNANRLRI
ncbi:PAS domain-containing protein [Paenibacillus sp. N3.4]|uniref:PAS domain-containing protein n=1 Tax=Paenibacillus sp. N3.4 TaxID=2603222 RepID=UPI0011C8188E|nr:PAS domain-containing protein [Paenibacillus sp. N3.4]TXK85448.1 PAS domain S-box protein [Paenibacillus sp. N3.4]